VKSVDPGVPPGFKVDLGWSVAFHKKVSKYKQGVGYVDQTSISDRFGWHYAKSFSAEKWYELNILTHTASRILGSIVMRRVTM
jgi:hypothetical protein